MPTAIATGAGAQYLFSDFARRGALAALYDFENRKPLFVGVHSSYRFCVLALAGRELRDPTARYAFFLQDPADLGDAERVFALSPEEIVLINPNTGTLPIFRTRRDADLTVYIQRHVPVLLEEGKAGGNPWGISFTNLFNSTDDSDIFATRSGLEADGWALHRGVFLHGEVRMLPVREGKMAHLFDHRWNSYYGVGDNDYELVSLEAKEDETGFAASRYWVLEEGGIPAIRKGKKVIVPGVSRRLKKLSWEMNWVVGWRDVARTTDERTAIPAFLPRSAAAETFPLMLPDVPAELVAGMVAAQSSLVFDFVARQKVGTAHMGRRTWKQLPVPSPADFVPHSAFIAARVVELVCTTCDMEPLARDLGDHGAPFRWDETRRAQIRAELDAYFFLLYGISREDTDYILESFQSASGGLKNNEIAKYGHYRTKDLVLAEYDRMAAAGVSLITPLVDGENYTSTLTPPPGHGPRHTAEPEPA